MTSVLTLLAETICITTLAITFFVLLAIFRHLLHTILGIKP